MMKNKKNIFKGLFLASFLMLGMSAFGQKIPADNIIPINGTYQTNVDGIGLTYKGDLNNLKIDNNTSVKLTSSSVLLGVLGVYPASLQFGYNATIPAYRPYYFRLSDSSGFAGILLGGAVGGFLGGLVFGSHWIEVTPYFNETIVQGGGRTDNYWNQSTTDNLAVMEDGFQNKFIRIVPKSNYNQIRFVDNTILGVVSVNTSELNYAYYNQGQNFCHVPIMTSFTGAGGVLSVGSQNPVTDAYKAVDTNPDSYSYIGGGKLLDVSLGSVVEQFFYLPEATNKKMARFKMSIPSGLLNVNVAQQSQIIFYNNNTEVGSLPINSDLLGIDLAGLINANNAPINFMAMPPLNAAGDEFINFDKISIKIVKPINVNLLGGADLRIYDVAFVDIKPEVKKVCSREFITNNIRERKFDIRHIIPNFNATNRYLIVDQNQNVIIDQLSTETYPTVESVKWQPLGTYYIKGINEPGYCSNQYESFVAEQDKQYTITGKSAISLPLDSNNDNTPDASFTFTSSLYSSDLPVNTGVRIYDELTNVDVTDQTINFPAIGSYNYYAKSVNAANDTDVTCDIIKRITVYVYDQEECEYRYVQTLATDYSSGGVLANVETPEKAADTDLSTHATLTSVIALVGIGTSWLDLKFDDVANNPIPKGTPLTIKLGQEYSLLQLIGGVTIQTLDKNGQPVGNLISIGELDLLNVLVGDNVFEFTYIPEDGVTAEGYGGVRILNGGVLALAASAKVYGAYIDKRIPINQAGVCDSNIEINGAEIPGNLDAHLLLNTSTDDVLYGVQDAGLGVATALSGVAYAYLAADAIEDIVNVNNPLNGTPNFETAAIFNTSVGALNRQTLTVKFKDIARPGDKVRITMSAEGAPVLDLNLLSNFTVQRYLGETPIGDVVTKDDFSLIKLDLLKLIADQASNKYVLTLEGIGASFDRVELRMDNVVSANLLGTRTYIYDVSVIPNFEFDENVVFCTSAPFRVEKLDPCSGYDLSFAYATLGTVADPITGEFEILGWNDIQNSTLPEIGSNDPRYDDEYHQYQLNKLYTEYSSVNNLYLKVVTKRQGCIYGDTQYFKIKIKNCGSISNPMIRTRLKSN